jgi:hypothetical protein
MKNEHAKRLPTNDRSCWKRKHVASRRSRRSVGEKKNNSEEKKLDGSPMKRSPMKSVSVRLTKK